MKFSLEIRLCNEAMHDGEDVAEALQRLRAVLQKYPVLAGQYGTIRDSKDNAVGEWRVTKGAE